MTPTLKIALRACTCLTARQTARRWHSHDMQAGSRAVLVDAPSDATNSTPLDLTQSERKLLESIIRVDQAGELAANEIYKGQLAVFRKPELRKLIQVRLACSMRGLR